LADTADAWPIVELVLVGLIVLGAVLFLYLHWSGTLARWRARSRPDVRVASLVRKRPPKNDDDCCR